MSQNTEKVLTKILNAYPDLNRNNVMFFTSYYHPIANVVIGMEEVSYEDYEFVEFMILKLISQDIHNSELISEMTGLGVNYIDELRRIIEGYGHTSNGELTDFGLRSINEGHKIQSIRSKQKYQIDALNLNIIMRKISSSDNNSYDIENTSMKAPHVQFETRAIGMEEFKEELSGKNLNAFRKLNSGLRSNLLSIDEIDLGELFFTEAYMMKYRGIDDVILFFESYDHNVKNVRDRFSFEAYGLTSQHPIFNGDINSKLTLYEVESQRTIKRLYEMAFEDAKRRKTRNVERYKQNIKELYSFNPSYVDLDEDYGLSNTIGINVTAGAYDKYENRLFDLIKAYDKSDETILASNYYDGLMYHLKNEDSVFSKIIKVFNSQKEYMSEEEIIIHLVEEMNSIDNSFEEESTLSRILSLLENMRDNSMLMT